MNCAEIVGVRTFLTHECGCGPHCAVRTADRTPHHSAGGLEAYSPSPPIMHKWRRMKNVWFEFAILMTTRRARGQKTPLRILFF